MNTPITQFVGDYNAAQSAGTTNGGNTYKIGQTSGICITSKRFIISEYGEFEITPDREFSIPIKSAPIETKGKGCTKNMSFACLIPTNDGIIVSADSLARTPNAPNSFTDKVFSVLDGKAAVAITGQLTYGDEKTPFYEIIKTIQAIALKDFAIELSKRMLNYNAVDTTVIWIVGYEDKIPVKYGLIGTSEQQWTFSVANLGNGVPYYSGIGWAQHYACTCPITGKTIEETIQNVQRLMKAICETDAKLPFIENTIGGEIKIIVIEP